MTIYLSLGCFINCKEEEEDKIANNDSIKETLIYKKMKG
jgi:hypothetical protein